MDPCEKGPQKAVSQPQSLYRSGTEAPCSCSKVKPFCGCTVGQRGGPEVLISMDLLLLALAFKSLMGETFVIARTVAPL